MAQSLAQKITGRLAGKIAGRVLGRLGSSVIPYIGWAVGVGLLVWDLVEGSQGALPTIREALQAEDVKQEVRAEITTAVAEGVAVEVETLASTMAVTLVGQWQEFCANHGVVCQLAAENSAFRTLLDNMPVTELTRLVQLTDFYLTEFDTEFGPELGEEQLHTALDDGTLARLLAAPPTLDTILAWTGEPATTLMWMDYAGEQLARVVELRLYETIDPHRMSTLSLAALLAIEDNALIHKLRLLPIDQLLILLQLPTADLTQVTTVATPDELGWLAGYLGILSSQEALAVAHELASGKLTIAALQAPPIAEAPSGDGTQATRSDAPVAGQSGADASGASANPTAGMPEAVVALWTPLAHNGVAVAAGIVVLLLVALGMAFGATARNDRPACVNNIKILQRRRAWISGDPVQ